MTRALVFVSALLLASTAHAHLVVDMKAAVRGPAFVAAGQQFTIEIVADNLANDNAFGLVVTTTLPAGVTHAGTTAPGWNCSASKSVVTCSAEELKPGEHIIAIRAVAPSQPGAQVTRVKVESIGSFDPFPNNDTASHSVMVYDPARCTAAAPALLSPADGAALGAASVPFSWSASADGARYTVRAATEGAGEIEVASTASTSALVPLGRGESTWRVIANFTDCPPVASATRRLTKTQAPAVALVDVATGFQRPAGIAFGPEGEMYVTDEQASVVWRVANGQATAIAGAPGEPGAANGQFARFNGPTGITVTPLDGFIYVADTLNNDVRILYTGGPFVPAFSVANATMKEPAAVAATLRGSIYVADTGNGVLRLMTPVSGTTGVFTITPVASFDAPRGVAVDAAGVVYVSDDHAVKKIPLGGAPATLASGFDRPGALALDAAGNLYVCDRGARVLYKVAPSGLVTPVAPFGDPAGVAVAADGAVYVADAGTRAVRRVDLVATAAPAAGPRRRAAGR
jgi:DNA-binding beta-propeller fold protein YncE